LGKEAGKQGSAAGAPPTDSLFRKKGKERSNQEREQIKQKGDKTIQKLGSAGLTRKSCKKKEKPWKLWD